MRAGSSETRTFFFEKWWGNKDGAILTISYISRVCLFSYYVYSVCFGSSCFVPLEPRRASGVPGREI